MTKLVARFPIFRLHGMHANDLESCFGKGGLIRANGRKMEFGGLGSSHTTPCGAAVPARPPTRSWHIKEPPCTGQWPNGAKERGTRVVVLVLYATPGTGKPLIRRGLRKRPAPQSTLGDGRFRFYPSIEPSCLRP
jgi:hypothetical protein